MSGPDRPPPQRYIVRPHLFLKPHQRVLCPNGHVVRSNAGILRGRDETLICQERGRGTGECGLRVYVLRMSDGRYYTAQVSPVEAIYLRDHTLSVDDALAYLSTPPRS